MGRVFGFLSLVLGLGVGMYLYSRQVQSSSAATGSATPQATINITGVKTDLMGIAAAERQYYASEAKYTSLDELISTHYVAVARQRPPYSYAVEIGAGGFRVVATRSGNDASGSPAQISVDQDMEFQTSQ
jgi:hypothetical protein